MDSTKTGISTETSQYLSKTTRNRRSWMHFGSPLVRLKEQAGTEHIIKSLLQAIEGIPRYVSHSPIRPRPMKPYEALLQGDDENARRAPGPLNLAPNNGALRSAVDRGIIRRLSQCLHYAKNEEKRTLKRGDRCPD